METVDTVQFHEPIHEPIQEAIGLSEVIYHCHVCMEAFVCEDLFRLHMDNHTAERPFECRICGVRFIDEVHLKKHTDLKHAREDVYEGCLVCGKLFHDKINLRSHMAVHSDDRPFPCITCGKSFKRKGELESHSVIHTGIKPYRCKLCYKSFTQKYSLKTHMRVHTGEKPFKCSICGKEFNRSSTVTLHMRQHTGAKPYHCVECNESYKFSRDLKKHNARVHGKEQAVTTFRRRRGRKPTSTGKVSSSKGKEKYECATCKTEFKSVANFNDHIKTHDVDSCYLCGQKLKNKPEKRRHVTRPISLKESRCYTCGVNFNKLEDFKIHMNGHSELCRLEECLRNAENLHWLSKKTHESEEDIVADSEEEDGDLAENSDVADDGDSDANSTQMDKIKTENHKDTRKSIGPEMFTVKQELISDEDEPDTTILELIEGGEGLQLKTQDVLSSTFRSQGIKESSKCVNNNSLPDSNDESKEMRRSPYKIASVSPPRTRGSLKVHFKEPAKRKKKHSGFSDTEKTLPPTCKNSPSMDGEDSDEYDLAETYSIYVKNMLRLQPIDKQMALIKCINTTIGQFIND